MTQVEKLHSEIDQLTEHIQTAQIAVGENLNILTRALREKQQKLEELEQQYTSRIEATPSTINYTPGMIEPAPMSKL